MALVVLAFGINSMSGALHLQNWETTGGAKVGSLKVAVGFVAPSLYENTLQSTMNITPTNDVLEKLDQLTKVDRTPLPSHHTHAHAHSLSHTRTHAHALTHTRT
jgi:6-phosphogluconolactonase (cycloisomerase 2 family)